MFQINSIRGLYSHRCCACVLLPSSCANNRSKQKRIWGGNIVEKKSYFLITLLYSKERRTTNKQKKQPHRLHPCQTNNILGEVNLLPSTTSKHNAQYPTKSQSSKVFLNNMSFATYKSPFDEAMSKPLISDDTQSVTNNNSTSGGSPLTSNNASSNQKSSLSSLTSVFHSKKLPFQNSLTPNINSNNNVAPPPPESFSKFNIDQANHSNTEEEEYQPPSLTLETTTESANLDQSSLEAALLRERNEESRSILQKMNTISAISSELNSLVMNQQETVDEMEENAYRIHDSAERGVAELEKANEMMRKNNGSGVEVFWKFFFGVIGVGGLIVAFVIFLHSFV